MANKMKLELKKHSELSDKEKKLVDNFILEECTNGEFINTLEFLEYHPKGKFNDDTVVLMDSESRSVRSLMVACTLPGKDDVLISHAGTTFAGPIINRKHSINNISEYLQVVLDYYESRYKRIELRLPPVVFGKQPFGTVEYILLKRGYIKGMKGLSNIIDISGIKNVDDILKTFYAKRRNQVKKVLKNNMFCLRESAEIQQNVWENMNLNLDRKFQSKTTHTLNEIRDLKNRFPKQISAYYVDTHDGDYGAFCLAFKFKNVFHTQYLDTNYNYTGQYPNLFLITRLIEIARSEGYSYFSFGASTENNGEYLNEGLYSYKADYGGGDVILPVFVKTM